jgi:hypothetical protein
MSLSQLLDATARKVVKEQISEFIVKHDVRLPEHIDDKQPRPVLALVAIDAGVLDIDALFTTKGPNQPRTRQNALLVLVPDTVTLRPTGGDQKLMVDGPDETARRSLEELRELAREVQAMRTLRERPQDHGISAARLAEQNFDARLCHLLLVRTRLAEGATEVVRTLGNCPSGVRARFEDSSKDSVTHSHNLYVTLRLRVRRGARRGSRCRCVCRCPGRSGLPAPATCTAASPPSGRCW